MSRSKLKVTMHKDAIELELENILANTKNKIMKTNPVKGRNDKLLIGTLVNELRKTKKREGAGLSEMPFA